MSLELTTYADQGVTAAVSPTDFRMMMANFPTGVSIVTAIGNGGAPIGMTCSSVCSVSVSPPTLIVCLRRESPTLAAVLARGSFAVNLLHEGSRSKAELFASGQSDRFDQVRWRHEPGYGGPHLVEDAHVVGHCRVGQTAFVGDHAVVFGEVRQVGSHPEERRPLLYGLRDYAAWPVPE
ncbi:flavin reductase family protein [Streptomyces sp. SID13031]|uniref:flavin reductase family protein n=1 Tax=Streptomyces sp. SID13031 TaxID=2706046 RepID=UPI0013C6028E|nr:flavin reductase family protein [Streptomyces sp. SID13031]NEA30613.1 flavin reductase family protein [Streptomyces sp. SID13031]